MSLASRHSPDTLALLVRAVGAERVVIGSDFPYDMGDPHAVEKIERAPFLSADERELALGRNALLLLGRK